MLVSLHPETKARIIIRVQNPSDLDEPSLKVVRRKKVVEIIHALGVVEPTQVFVQRAPRVVSSLVRLHISCGSF